MSRKKKKQTGKLLEKQQRQSSDLTALELAFLQAEQQKRKTVKEKKKTLSAGNTPQKNPEKPKQITGLSEDSQADTKKKDKRVYIPPQVPKKTDNVSQPQKKSTVAANRSAQKTPSPKKTVPVNLGIKQMNEELISLQIPNIQNQEPDNKTDQHLKLETQEGVAQVHGGKAPMESDIVIGFDFGTSSSKIVFRDSGRQTAYAVPFDDLSCEGNSYLLPTKIFINNDGSISLSQGQHKYNNLKVSLMDTPDIIVFKATTISETISASELAVAYLSLALRHARGWFLKKTESIYKDTHIYWSINLGIPSKNYDDKFVRDSFRAMALAAWRASRIDGPISIIQIKEFYQEANELIKRQKAHPGPEDLNSPWLHPDFVNSHPEVIMEIVGYARSPMRTNGLHLLVDVGATTMDAATFYIHNNDDGDIFPLLETTVQRYGTMALHRKRIFFLKTNLEKQLSQINGIDSNKALPEAEYYGLLITENQVSENDNDFFKECSKSIGKIIQETQDHRAPYSDTWRKGLPVFVCGGGRRLPSYINMLKRLERNIAKNIINFNGFIMKEIPKPNQLEAPALSFNDYDRLAVAYGLSFTVDEIGEIIPESKISDIHKRKKPKIREYQYVSKEMC